MLALTLPTDASADPSAAQAPPPLRTRAARDAAVVLGCTVAAFAAASATELAEAFAHAMQHYEHWQADELPFALLVAAFGLAWFAWRRLHEARAAVRLHQRSRAQVDDLLDRNRHLAQQLIELQENERRALARELHDELAQHCTAIRIESAWIGRAAAHDGAGVAAAAARIDSSAQALHGMVRGMLRRLRPDELDELGLVDALQSLCERWEATSGVDCMLLHDDPDSTFAALGDAANVALYRIAQEGLSNVMRHARAGAVRLRLARERDGGVRLSIEDDGIGIDARSDTHGLGLVGAAERAASLGGTLQVRPRAGGGTTLDVRLPVRALQHATAAA